MMDLSAIIAYCLYFRSAVGIKPVLLPTIAKELVLSVLKLRYGSEKPLHDFVGVVQGLFQNEIKFKFSV